MNNIINSISSSQLSLAAFAHNLAKDHALDITKIYCRKTGKLIGHRTSEEISLLEKLFPTCKSLTDKLNLCDSISPAFAKIQTETLNILEEEDPVSLFIYYLNLLTRQFNETITTKGARTFISTEAENKFKNSLVLAHAFAKDFVGREAKPSGEKESDTLHDSNFDNSNLDNINQADFDGFFTSKKNDALEKLKDCNNKLRWLLTLNLPIKRFYVVDISNALDFVGTSEKSILRKEVDWMERDKFSKLPAYRYVLQDAIQQAKKLHKIVEHTFYVKWAIFCEMKQFEKIPERNDRMFDLLSKKPFVNGESVFYDPITDACYKAVEDVPTIQSVAMRDFSENPILPHELATERGIDWIVKYFPRAFARCKEHLLRNMQQGWHAYDGINRVFGRGNKSDQYSNEFVEFLSTTQRMFVATKSRKDFNKTKNSVLAAQRNAAPLTIESISFVAESFAAKSVAKSVANSIETANPTISSTSPLTFMMKSANVTGGAKIVFDLKKQV